MGKFLGDAASDVYYGENGSPTGGDQLSTLTPRNRFNYTVTFNFYAPDRRSITTHRVKDILLPGVTYRTQTINQYNKKRIVQTGFDFDPITLSIYDTKDNEVDYLIKEYASFYYHGNPFGDESDLSSKRPDDIINSNFNTNFSGKGLKLNPDKYFFRSIVITRSENVPNSEMQRWTLGNPLFSRIEGDQLDYSDSQPSLYRMQVAYEDMSLEHIPLSADLGTTQQLRKQPDTSFMEQAGGPAETVNLSGQTGSDNNPLTVSMVLNNGSVEKDLTYADINALIVAGLTKDSLARKAKKRIRMQMEAAGFSFEEINAEVPDVLSIVSSESANGE